MEFEYKYYHNNRLLHIKEYVFVLDVLIAAYQYKLGHLLVLEDCEILRNLDLLPKTERNYFIVNLLSDLRKNTFPVVQMNKDEFNTWVINPTYRISDGIISKSKATA